MWHVKFSSCYSVHPTIHISARLQLNATYNSSVEVDYLCSTVYATQVQITIMDASNLRFTNLTTCSEGRLEFSIDSDNCVAERTFCGYFTFENGSTFTDCALDCSTVSVECPTTRSPPTPGI